MKKFLLALLVLCSAPAAAGPMKLDDYLALSGPPASAKFAYGSAPSQYAELFLPSGTGPFPVVVLVHGGCWTVRFGGIAQMHNLAGALAARGIAVWNVEYRRIDEEGGGYPGTYQDIEAALDALAANAESQQLDLRRLAAVGHSAGGQLVQWLAGRARIAPTSPLYQAKPLLVNEIISLGGLADLRNEKDLIKASCGRDTEQLAGKPSAVRPDVFSDTNAAELIPNGSHTVLVNGALDTISPPRAAHDYAERVRKAGDSAETVILPEASHYDEVATTSPAWKLILPLLERAVGKIP